MYIVSGKTETVGILFEDAEGALVEPVGNIYTYAVIQPDGTVLDSGTPAVPSPETSATHILAAPHTTKTTGADFDVIILEYSYDTAEGTFSNSITYKLIERQLYMTTASEVRSALGVTEMELPDKDIDLFAAYMTIKNVDFAEIDTALAAGGFDLQNASNLIMYYTACLAVDSLALRLLQSHTEDNIVASRFSKVDLDRLKGNLMARYIAALSQLSDTFADDDISVGGNRFVVFNPTPDVITNV